MPNRRFGTYNKFGTSNQFGASSGMGTSFKFGLEIDWDNDRHFDGTNEATVGGINRFLAWKDRRGREFFFNSNGNNFQPVKTGEIVFTLKNTDRRYDPYYVSGDLFTDLQKNPMCRFRILDEDTAVLHDEFFGYVVDVRPKYSAGMDTVDIVVNDGIKKLKDKNITSAFVYAAVQYDEQIYRALVEAGWQDTTSIDGTLSDTLTYHWFSGNSAFSEITSLNDAAFGLFFVAKDGTATYKSRISGDTSVLSLTEDDIDYAYGIQAPSPRDVIKNDIKIYARARTAQAGVTLWTLGDKPLLATGTGAPIWANYSYNGEDAPATSIIEPVSGTDYNLRQNVDGSGTNFDANLTLNRTGFATSSKLIPTNSGTGAYLTLLKIRGTAITADKYTFANSTDDTSINTFGRKELIIKSDWLQDLNTAQEQAGLFLDRFKTLRFFPRVKIKRDSIAAQLTPDLFDLVSINFASKQVTGEMRVGYIERSWTIQEPTVMDTVMYFEPNLTITSAGAWVFPITLPATLG